MRAPYSRYSEEFRNDAIALYRRSDRGVRELAADLGMNHWTLRDWVEQDGMKRKKSVPKQVTAIPKAETLEQRNARLEFEVKQLQRKVAQLEEDREILKKAAAFFAKESE